MKQHSQPRLVKDERDAQIDTRSRSAALDFVIAATQVLTLICLVKSGVERKPCTFVYRCGDRIVLQI